MPRPTPTRSLAVPAAALLLVWLTPLAADEKKAPPAPPSPKAAAEKSAPGPGTVKPEPPKITLRWSTASEVDNYGFFVLRGEDEKGPFKALNEKAIPGAGNSDLPKAYAYEDLLVTPGKTYYYYLESVSTLGVREKFSPVIKKECCKGYAATPAAPADGKKDAAPSKLQPAGENKEAAAPK